MFFFFVFDKICLEGFDMELFSDKLTLILPPLKRLLFSDQQQDHSIGLQTKYHEEMILFNQVFE